MVINKSLLELRNSISKHTPVFRRQESWRYKRVETSWRKPKGIDSFQRKQNKGWPHLVRVGYGIPRKARYLHPSGYTDNLVHNIKELEALDPKKDGIRLAHTVGKRKRIQIIEQAKEKHFKIFNGRVSIKSGSKS